MVDKLYKAVAIGLLSFSVSVYANPVIQQWQAPSGAKVLFVENHDLPMLDVAVNFQAGSRFDSAEKIGLAAMTHALLALGSEGLSEDDVARKLADIGALQSGGFDADRASIRLRTLSNNTERNAALDIIARILQQPVFSNEVLDREKTRWISSLKEAETKPESIASKAFAKAVFATHPYGYPASGEVTTIERLQRIDLVSFYNSHYGAESAVVAIMGDVSRAEAEEIAQNLTAKLPAGSARSEIANVNKLTAASVLRIEHPATQSHILIGAPGVARNDPDYYALYVGNYILGGGGFVSRLMHEVREKRGLAYSVYSYFMPMQQPGAFQIGLQTRKDQADVALDLVNKTLRDFVAHGVTQKELHAAKQNIINGFPLRIDSNSKILDYLSVIGFYNLPLTYIDDFQEKIRKVTAYEVQAAFKRKINPAAMATVIVGALPDNTKKSEGEGK